MMITVALSFCHRHCELVIVNLITLIFIRHEFNQNNNIIVLTIKHRSINWYILKLRKTKKYTITSFNKFYKY